MSRKRLWLRKPLAWQLNPIFATKLGLIPTLIIRQTALQIYVGAFAVPSDVGSILSGFFGKERGPHTYFPGLGFRALTADFDQSTDKEMGNKDAPRVQDTPPFASAGSGVFVQLASAHPVLAPRLPKFFGKGQPNLSRGQAAVSSQVHPMSFSEGPIVTKTVQVRFTFEFTVGN